MRVDRFATGALSVLLLGATPTGADEPDAAALSRFVEAQVRASRLPGVAVCVVRGEVPVYAATFGEGGARIGADTPFLIGSVTKTFTALAVAQLVDQGKVRFDDPVHQHLPGFALDSPDGGRAITLRHLLTHTSGLRQWSGHDARAQHEGRFDHIAPGRPPGTEAEYSSLNYIVLGRVVEAVSGTPYATFLQDRVFAPLEMTNSTADLQTARRRGLVAGHFFLFGLAVPRQEIQQPAPLVPAGFVASSARDLGHYLGMLGNGGRFRGRQVVSAESLRQMLTPWNGAAAGAGMAWGIGRTQIGHAGNTGSFSARLALLPSEGYGVVVLANVNSGPFFAGTAAVMDGIVRVLRGEEVEPARPDEILFKVGVLLLMLAGAVRTLITLRTWARRGFPRRLESSRRVLMPLVTEALAAGLVLIAVPRWLGVPATTILEYFPDLGIAIVVGVSTGAAGALMRSFLLADQGPATVTPAA